MVRNSSPANDYDVEDGRPTLAGFTVTGVSGIALTNAAVTAAISIEKGQLKFNPGNLFDGLSDGQHATITISYTAVDSEQGSATGTFTLTVNGVTDLNQVIGTSGADALNGSNGADNIVAGDGNDRIYTRDGDDIVDAGAGDDYVYAGAGNKTIHAGDGNDIVFDFKATGADHDVVQIDASKIADFATLMNAVTDSAGGAQHYDDRSMLTLAGVKKSALVVDDFHFA
jgi:Ca2+-binding RTX toxin-like protein